MDAVILLVVLVGLAAFVAMPLYRGAPGPSAADDPGLEARKEALVAELRELDLDRASGLLDEDEYRAQRTDTETRAAAVFRDLDGRQSD